MKIMVYDVAADSSGALTILNNYYDLAKADTKNEWVFVVSVVDLQETKNIKVLKFPKIKKSWLHRILFDKFTAPKLIKKLKIDKVLNLQNVAIKTGVIKQMLYVHQPLPFVDYKFKISDFKMWIYQNIIGKMIKKSCKKVDEIIVQTTWMKDAIIKQCKVNHKKIKIEVPKIKDIKVNVYKKQKHVQFFYPATALKYKNHKVILEACKQIKDNNYTIFFTLDGTENKLSKSLKIESEKLNLPIKWIGKLTQKQVYDFYSKSILLFPSLIETLGLPLIEAQKTCSPIISAQTPWAKELCAKYNNVKFFKGEDAVALANYMKEQI